MRLLRTVALIVLAMGAAASFVLMLRAGGPRKPFLLTILFTGWDLLPFVVLALAEIRSKTWSRSQRATLYATMLIMTLLSLAEYITEWKPAGTKAAFPWVTVPLASYILISVVALKARGKSSLLHGSPRT